MKPQHKKWADLVVKGMSEIDAYLQVYPKAGKKTAGNQLGTFRKNVGLMGYITKEQDRIAAIIDAKTVDKLSEVQMGNVLTSNDKRAILLSIAKGEIEIEKLVLVRDTNKESVTFGKLIWKKMMVKPDLSERMKAIDIDNKMSGDVFRAKPHELNTPPEENIEDLFKNTTFVFKGPSEDKS